LCERRKIVFAERRAVTALVPEHLVVFVRLDGGIGEAEEFAGADVAHADGSQRATEETTGQSRLLPSTLRTQARVHRKRHRDAKSLCPCGIANVGRV
jgi:hypothetical protein